ncbi:MiaB/RimO family radical SAM methylthiotransferase [Chloroflexota bacterium]
MLKYYIWTIGCQMNKAESARLGGYLEERGYQTVARAEEAELIVLNSCVVRQSAENRVLGKLGNLKALKKERPRLTLAVTGCLVSSDINSLQRRFPHVDYFFGPGEYPTWIATDGANAVIPERPSPVTLVPIIQGCNNFCSYCIVPHRRGREKSRPLKEVAGEVKTLVNRGVREVTLLGQNVDSYGHDLEPKTDLASLLNELNAIKGLARIRFLTNHPKDMSPRLIEAVATMDKVCEEISLPVQAGSDAILKAMERGYTAAHYRELIGRIRGKVPGIALSTDVIVGFPSETEAQFQETYDLLSTVGFDKVHVAAYSPRPGTTAARKFEDNVPAAAKKERLRRVEELQEKVAGGINARLRGEAVEVLVDGAKGGKWQGRTRGGKLAFFIDGGDWLGKLVNVRIEKTSPWALQGNLRSGSADKSEGG